MPSGARAGLPRDAVCRTPCAVHGDGRPPDTSGLYRNPHTAKPQAAPYGVVRTYRIMRVFRVARVYWALCAGREEADKRIKSAQNRRGPARALRKEDRKK